MCAAALLACAACGGSRPIDASTSGDPDAGSHPTPPNGGGQPDPRVTLSVHVSGQGRVISSPAGIDCRDDCTAQFTAHAVVALSAVPDAAQSFQGFGGACAASTCTLTVDADASVSAVFAAMPPAPPRLHTVTVEVSGSGAGRVVSTPAGIDCSAPGICSAQFAAGTPVSLAAAVDLLSSPAKWSGACSGTSCAFTVGGDARVRVAIDDLHYRAIDLGVLPGGWWSQAG